MVSYQNIRQTADVRISPAFVSAFVIRPAEILESRFLNRDGATFLQERFEQTTIVELYEWFVDRRGGDRGRRFLREAPLSPPWCRPRGLTGMGAYSPTFLPDLAS